jgi:hypothetical protein
MRRWLEIPAWMFDRAARAAWRVGAAPYVDIAVLTALATLLQDVTSVSGAPSQLRVSSAAFGSDDANRGDAMGTRREAARDRDWQGEFAPEVNRSGHLLKNETNKKLEELI